jgi:hypothetical protein
MVATVGLVQTVLTTAEMEAMAVLVSVQEMAVTEATEAQQEAVTVTVEVLVVVVAIAVLTVEMVATEAVLVLVALLVTQGQEEMVTTMAEMEEMGLPRQMTQVPVTVRQAVTPIWEQVVQEELVEVIATEVATEDEVGTETLVDRAVQEETEVVVDALDMEDEVGTLGVERARFTWCAKAISLLRLQVS